MTHAELIHRLEVLRSYCVTTKVEAQYVDALFEVIEILEKLKPDPATGLMPCGCGGKPVILAAGTCPEDLVYWLECGNKGCRIGTNPTTSEERAKTAWNRAMSGNCFQEEEAK